MNLIIGVASIVSDATTLSAEWQTATITEDGSAPSTPHDAGADGTNNIDPPRHQFMTALQALDLYGLFYNGVDGLCTSGVTRIVRPWMLARIQEANAAFMEANPDAGALPPAAPVRYALDTGAWLEYWFEYALGAGSPSTPAAISSST